MVGNIQCRHRIRQRQGGWIGGMGGGVGERAVSFAACIDLL